MSQGLLVQLGGVGLLVPLGTNAGLTQEIFMQAYGVTTAVGLLLPYTRLQKSEADHIGLVLMAKAGYDPREAIPALIPEVMRYYQGK
jgi:predicted Zn-dependent protease